MKKAQTKIVVFLLIIIAIALIAIAYSMFSKPSTTGEVVKEDKGIKISETQEEVKEKEYELYCRRNCVEIIDGERYSLLKIVGQEYDKEDNSILFELQNFHGCKRRCSIDNGKDSSKLVFIQPLEIYEGKLKIYEGRIASITCMEGVDFSRGCMPDEKQVFIIREK